MRKIITYIVSISLFLSTLTACGDWLDETSSSEVREDEQFNSEVGFQQALLGCYIAMTKENLYGRNLSWYIPDLLAQTYNATASGRTYVFQQYNFGNSRVSGIVEATWRDAYNVIANANNALKFVEKNGSILHPINHDMIKGELLAIRAFMHFELLRLYGHGDLAHRADKGTKLTIPYVTTVSKEMTPQETYSKIMATIIAELKEAERLLEIDPITAKHPASYYEIVNTDGFYNNRQMRLNYYAVRAILARVYMWEGSVESLSSAKEILTGLIELNEERNLFKWTIDADMDRDPICSTEHLFALNPRQEEFFTTTMQYFKGEFVGTDYEVFYIREANLRTMYEFASGGNTDIRYVKLFYANLSAACTPLKYAPGLTTTLPKVAKVPLIRLPELYYMAAECYGSGITPDYGKAKELLTTVRATRGIVTDMTCNDRTSLLLELKKEYQKEFVAEGHLFYFYKRTGEPIIMHPGGSEVTMNDAKYILPYPEYEIRSGRIQF